MATQKTDFSLSVNVNPDTSQVQKTLNHQPFKINVQIDIDTRTVQNRINNLFQNQRLLGRNGQVLGQSLNQIQRGVLNVNTETDHLKQTINGVNISTERVIKSTTDTAGITTQVIKLTNQWIDANGRLNKSIETTNERGEQIAPTITTIDDEFQQATQNTNLFGRALDGLFEVFKREAIMMFYQTLHEAVDVLKEFDSALIEFRKVSDLAGESLTNYVAKLAQMGEITGSTMQAMVEAATQFRKSGFTDEDSAQLASVAEMYRNIADEEISAADSASFIIAQMKAFNIEAGQAEHIIDAVNEV